MDDVVWMIGGAVSDAEIEVAEKIIKELEGAAGATAFEAILGSAGLSVGFIQP